MRTPVAWTLAALALVGLVLGAVVIGSRAASSSADPVTSGAECTVPLTATSADPADPAEVKLERFGELFGSTEGYLPLSPYWLTVRDGVVVAIEEQFIP